MATTRRKISTRLGEKEVSPAKKTSVKATAVSQKTATTKTAKTKSAMAKKRKPVCRDCKRRVEEWNEECKGCGFTLILEPEERTRARFLRGPSLGAMFWTQGWAFGAKLYLWFLLSLIPVVGLVTLPILLIFGRRLAWKFGGYSSWEDFKQRMLLMDIIGTIWIVGLVAGYYWIRYSQGI